MTLTETSDEKLVLAHAGKTACSIIYDFSGDVLLDPAVRDLAATLEEITGAKFPIRSRAAGPCIFIGIRAPRDRDDFEPRERRIKSVGQDIYIYGDYRYGVAGAIYNFLSVFCNCRWYTITGNRRIPKDPDLSFPALDYRHVPSFKSLEHGGKCDLVTRDRNILDWVRRNNAFIMPDYSAGMPEDGWTYIGPVTHTLAAYLPPVIRKPRTFNDDGSFMAGPHPCFAGKEYFKDHPEYFSMDTNGKRVPGKQLCFSNPEVRALLLKNIDIVIRAEKYDPDHNAILDFTQNDKIGGFCHCEACKRLNEKYRTPGGAYFDFLVEMGRHFAPKYPKLMFRFFSYKEDMTGIPPQHLVFPENMSVIIAPLQQDFSKPLSSEHNIRFLKQMRKWSRICKEIWLWNYPMLYTHGMVIYSLFPGVRRNTENLKLAHEASVRYIIAEQGGSIFMGQSFKELNVYLQDRMAEDVNVDVNAEIKEFCEAVYGAAAPDIMRYIDETDRLCKKDPGFLIYHYDPRVMRRVLHTPANLVRWQRDFDRMEALVRNDRHALFNVRRARLNLDAVTLLMFPACAKHNPDFAAETTLDKLYRRYCRRLREDARFQLRDYPDPVEGEKEFIGGFLTSIRMVYEFHRRKHTYPRELIEKYGEKNLFSVMPAQSRRPPAKWDKLSSSGFAVEIPAPTGKETLVVEDIRVALKDGMPWNTVTAIPLDRPLPTPAELVKAGRGYRLFYCGRSKLSESGMVMLATVDGGNRSLRLSMRNARCFLGDIWDTAGPDREYDFYLSVQPAPGGKSLFVDRLVLGRPKSGK